MMLRTPITGLARIVIKALQTVVTPAFNRVHSTLVADEVLMNFNIRCDFWSVTVVGLAKLYSTLSHFAWGRLALEFALDNLLHELYKRILAIQGASPVTPTTFRFAFRRWLAIDADEHGGENALTHFDLTFAGDGWEQNTCSGAWNLREKLWLLFCFVNLSHYNCNTTRLGTGTLGLSFPVTSDYASDFDTVFKMPGLHSCFFEEWVGPFCVEYPSLNQGSY